MDATQGHALFERWLIRTYGESTRSPGRPVMDGMRRFRDDLAEKLQELKSTAQPIKNAGTIYHWLASAQPNSRRRPDTHLRAVVALMSRGEVPEDAWEQPRGEAA